MATKITLSIEADTPDELATTIAGLAALNGVDNVTVEYNENDTPIARPRMSRKRAEAAAPAATSTSGSQAATDGGGGPGPTATTATTAASPSDAVTAADLLGDGAAGDATKPLSESDVKAKMAEAMQKSTPLKVQDALKEAGLGARFTEIPTSKWGEAMTVFEKLIAG